MKILYIGKQFSDDPAGRYYTDGDGSGEEFREEVLRPLLKLNKPLTINIDENVEGYGSSFLVEAFGGLIKHGYFESDYINRVLNLDFNDSDFEFYARKIKQYIKEAIYNSEQYESTKETAINEGKFKGSIDKSFLEDFK
ncbi:STAS-like domain-containing protein [Litoribacillus peritrichatus]|uniref:DUF4325 domain-containing protein n=1 Tax=Litoribacillus peritrichatus TaxID=718191 RepID=A0ABP7MLD1_9GAMM